MEKEASLFFDGYFKGCGGETLPCRDGKDSRCGEVLRFSTQTDGELADRIRAFCKDRGTGPSVFFALAFGLALKAYTNTEETYFTACLSDGGFSGQRLPVPMACKADETVASMLTAFGTYLQTADTYGKDCFAQLAERYGMRGDVLFRYQRAEDSSFADAAAFSVTVTASADGGAFRFEATCDATRYSAYTLRGFALLFMQIGGELPCREKNGEIALLSSEQERELRDYYDTDYPVAERPAYRLLQDTAEKTPEKTALIAVDRTMTYRELNGEANTVGHALRGGRSYPAR